MRSRLRMGIVAVLTLIVAGGTQVAAAWEPSRLAAMAARQQLRDDVCVAMADGQINRFERYLILTDAKRCLKPEEYAGFKESLDRISPPKPATAKKPVKIMQKNLAKMVPKKSPPPAQQEAPPPAVTDYSRQSDYATEIAVREPMASTGEERYSVNRQK
jgi:hypothetical protein